MQVGKIIGALGTKDAELLAGLHVDAGLDAADEAVHMHQASSYPQCCALEPDSVRPAGRIGGSNHSAGKGRHDRCTAAAFRLSRQLQIEPEVARPIVGDALLATNLERQVSAVIPKIPEADH